MQLLFIKHKVIIIGNRGALKKVSLQFLSIFLQNILTNFQNSSTATFCRTFKIGQYLAKITTKVGGLLFGQLCNLHIASDCNPGLISQS